MNVYFSYFHQEEAKWCECSLCTVTINAVLCKKQFSAGASCGRVAKPGAAPSLAQVHSAKMFANSGPSRGR